MTLNQYELRLQAANPNLRVKRYGTSYAAIFYGNQHICRLPQGEITAYSVVEETLGTNDFYKSEDNPLGLYKFDLIKRRGRHAAARMLLGKHLINHADLAKIAF